MTIAYPPCRGLAPGKAANVGWLPMRSAGLVFGLGAQAAFLTTLPFLFWFLRYGGQGSGRTWWMTDSLLALQFSVSHSLLLYPPIRNRIARYLPSALYGCFFCLATCGSLAIVFAGWQGSPGQVWKFEGLARIVILAGFYGSWLALVVSLYWSGLGYQTGLLPWWYWVRQRPAPAREFQVRGAFRLVRHPVYLSVLGLIWFSPRLSYDRVLLILIWTTYILIGSHLKDERLAKYLGERYRRYQEQVPGYPCFPSGGLGRRRPRTL